MNKITELENLESGHYYQINGTKKVLYWNGTNWQIPIKDYYKRFTYVGPPPKDFKFKYAININELPDISWQYKPII